jgi:hypothetical protein
LVVVSELPKTPFDDLDASAVLSARDIAQRLHVDARSMLRHPRARGRRRRVAARSADHRGA